MFKDLLIHLDVFSQLWHHHLLTIQGIKLTLGNIILALLMLALTGRVSKLVSKILMRRLVEPFVNEPSALVTYRRLVYLCSIASCMVLALTIAGIPLAIFSVVGGALAIGVGFGSQNLVSNFISGLIMLVERPFKVGDIVALEGVSGTVTEIGTRSTQMMTVENRHWIIPNSMFLEKAVLNWTHDDTIIRAEVEVGVGYNMDIRKAQAVAMQVLQDFPEREAQPEPLVVFDEFGDSSLVLKLYFWCDTKKVGTLMQARSELRFRIAEAFTRENIEISYPQRDLHIKSATPLEVRVRS